MTRSRTAAAFANTALLLASCVATLLAFEVALRLLHPKYEHLADTASLFESANGVARIPNHRGMRRDPDTLAPHAFFHNNFGSRQHRNFSAENLDSSTNVGFFGDSFTENVQLPAPFSLTEPLDYLLNVDAGSGEEGGGGVNVLNFGMAAYGMSQSLLRYETWKFRQTLDHVFYIHAANDVGDDRGTGVFRLDDAGRLTRVERPRSVGWALLSKMHLSYLAWDATNRLTALFAETANKAEQPVNWVDEAKQPVFLRRWHVRRDEGGHLGALALFRQQLRRFKAAVEQGGGSFTLVYLPLEDYAASGVADIVREEDVETINLRNCFGERDPAHLQTPWVESPYRFESDWHWNKRGNRLAAVCLHRFLERRLGLPQLSEERVERALARYYSAFEAPGGQPAAGEREATPLNTREPAPAAIRRKYNTLEAGWPELWTPWAPSPDKLAIRADFDVYLHDGWLAYVREDCQVDNAYLGFYLHIYPEDVQDLPPHRLEWGFDNLDFWYFFREAPCTAWRALPDYPIARIQTGGLGTHGASLHQKTWEAEHVLAE